MFHSMRNALFSNRSRKLSIKHAIYSLLKMIYKIIAAPLYTFTLLLVLLLFINPNSQLAVYLIMALTPILIIIFSNLLITIKRHKFSYISLQIGIFWVPIVVGTIYFSTFDGNKSDIVPFLLLWAEYFLTFLGLTIAFWPIDQAEIDSLHFILFGKTTNTYLNNFKLFEDMKTFELFDDNPMSFIVLLHHYRILNKYRSFEKEINFFKSLKPLQLEYFKQKVKRLRRRINLGSIISITPTILSLIPKKLLPALLKISLVNTFLFYIVLLTIPTVIIFIIYYLYTRHLNYVAYLINYAEKGTSKYD